MGRFFRALFKLTLRVLLAVVILCLVLVPALWLGRDNLPPRLAAWGINYVLGAPVVHPLDDEFAQLVHAEVGCVDDEIGGLDDRVEQFALARDRLLQRLAGLREGMPTLGLAEPAQQFGVGGGHR